MLIIFLPIFITTISTNAQVKIGVSSGINIASYTLSEKSPEATTETKTGFLISCIIDIPIFDRFSVRIAPAYIQRGGKVEIPSVSDKPVLNYDYLLLAPYLTYGFNFSKITARLLGGLSFGYLVYAQAEYEGDEVDLMSLTNRFNLTTDVGCEIEINIFRKLSFIIDGIYSIGQSDISKAMGETKTKDLQLSVGILFDLRKS